MTAFDELVPLPGRAIDWQTITAAFDWFRALRGCPQDPIFHAEGDVAIHTRLVAEALVDDPVWQALDGIGRACLFWAALLHDVAKPATTRADEYGRIAARGHSRRGQIMSRQILWRLGVPFAQREQICHLVTHHQLPLYLLERDEPTQLLHRVSYQTRCDWLAILARADVTGRICPDAARLLDNIALFEEAAREAACLSFPRAFPSDHSRFEYFRRPGRHPDFDVYDDWSGRVVLLSGLPASGKDKWIATNGDATAVISLDVLRTALNVDPAGDQGHIVAVAREKAREHLRVGRPLIWNATNLSRDRRAGLIGLFADYRAKVEIVYCETSVSEMRRRNARRPSPVPSARLARMLEHWAPPDLTECHRLNIVISGY